VLSVYRYFATTPGRSPNRERLAARKAHKRSTFRHMQLKRVAEAKLPTPWGDFLMVGFEELATGQDHVESQRRLNRASPVRHSE
jgi:hypothetical protein